MTIGVKYIAYPNASGYDKMARAWEPAVRAVISTTQFQ